MKTRNKMVMRASAFTVGLLAFAAPAVAAEQPTEGGGGTDTAAVSITTVPGVTEDDGSTVFKVEQSQLTILPATGPQPSETELSALAAGISCSLNVEYVHPSTHVNGTINGIAKITCDGVGAGYMTLDYSLTRVSPNPTQWGAGQKNGAGNTLQNNRAVPCSEGPGDFGGWAQGVITPPPGYTLVGSSTNSKWGAVKSVACGLARFAADSSESPTAESTVVTFVRNDLAH